jgi:hypothetical protein
VSENYAQHTVALEILVKRIQQALRDKRLSDADHFCAEAAKRLALIQGHIARLDGSV